LHPQITQISADFKNIGSPSLAMWLRQAVVQTS